MFRWEVIQQITIKSNDFAVEPELTAKIFKNKRLRVYELPISYYGRTYEEGRRFPGGTGWRAMIALIKYRFMN